MKKSVKITNHQIISVLDIIGRLKAVDRVLPVKVSYVLNLNQNILLGLYKVYETTLKDLDKDSDQDKIIELLNLENEVDLYVLDLDDILEAELSIKEVEVIQTFMLTNEEE